MEEVDDRVDDRWMVGSHGWMVDGGWIYPYPFRSDFWFKDERGEKCQVFEQKSSNIPISKMKRYEKSVLVEIHFDYQAVASFNNCINSKAAQWECVSLNMALGTRDGLAGGVRSIIRFSADLDLACDVYHL